MSVHVNFNSNDNILQNFAKNTLEVAIFSAVQYGVSYIVGTICNLRVHAFAKISTIGMIAAQSIRLLINTLARTFHWNRNTVKILNVTNFLVVGALTINTLVTAGIIGQLGTAILVLSLGLTTLNELAR